MPHRPAHLCSQCARTFKDVNNFREHLFQEHGELGVNVRQCHLCSYATLLKSKYDCHIRCHLNNRVLRCPKCNYSTINIRHMSKHERQHSLAREAERPRFDNARTEAERAAREKASHAPNAFANCFLADRIRLPDEKRPREESPQPRSSSCCSNKDSDRTTCPHRDSLVSLRANVWTLLRMLLPQLAFYSPSTATDPDHSIDTLVGNLLQIPTFQRTYPSA